VWLAALARGCGGRTEPEETPTKVDPPDCAERAEAALPAQQATFDALTDDASHTPTGKRHCVNPASLIFVSDGEDVATVLAAHRASAEPR